MTYEEKITENKTIAAYGREVAAIIDRHFMFDERTKNLIFGNYLLTRQYNTICKIVKKFLSTELPVFSIRTEFEKAIAFYRDTVPNEIERNTIDAAFHSLKGLSLLSVRKGVGA